MLGWVVKVVQAGAVVAALVFVVALFANEPSDGAAPSGGAPDGAALYAQRCAVCHGADGGGGSGPRLSGGQVVERYPDIEDQIAVVTDGRGGMPAFGDRLTAEEIEAIVIYEREDL